MFRLHPAPVLCAIALIATPAFACTKRKTGAMPIVRARQLSATSWQLFVPGYQTKAVPIGVGFCAVGIDVPTGSRITSIDSIAANLNNSSSMPHWSFATNTSIASSFDAVQKGKWTGFLASVSGPQAGGSDHMFALRVTVTSGTTFAQLETAVKALTIGTDGATSAGALTNQDRFLLKPTTVTEDKTASNAKLFHNRAKANAATRATTTSADTLYFMQPAEARFGAGGATGFEVRLQDMNGATAELVELGFVKYASNGTSPDTSASGELTRVGYTLFGSGVGNQSKVWTLSTAGLVAVPRLCGTFVTLPKPKASTDVVTIWTQDGAQTKVAAVARKQMTFSRAGANAANYRAAGTTLHLGGLFDVPVVFSVNTTNAYGSKEKIYGPEAVFPSSARGDLLGFGVRTSDFAGTGNFALLFVSPDYLSTPLPSPFGDVLLQTLISAGFPFPIPASGNAETPLSVPVPAGLNFAVQGILFNFGSNPLKASFTDAIKVRTQS